MSKNKTVIQLMRIISKLVKADLKDVVNHGVFSDYALKPIKTAYCKHNTKLFGKKWLAPKYRTQNTYFQIKKGAFVAIRENGKYSDLEYIDSATKESVVYTVTTQEWLEKEGYFELIPPERYKGGLGEVVNKLLYARKKYERQKQQ